MRRKPYKVGDIFRYVWMEESRMDCVLLERLRHKCSLYKEGCHGTMGDLDPSCKGYQWRCLVLTSNDIWTPFTIHIFCVESNKYFKRVTDEESNH